ncbi:ribokinase [Catellatospora bangladeshensis]|uniref:Ribokinase n=1 Tax=Catellatospora bangladeshensis TaxID=310355 RepID=A0A8J3NHU9_9ACTN|nr:ribokinase [Catellatospora bangladeshensis]GIF79631.1 ribokinase [Catellatospora bangladeshensis]
MTASVVVVGSANMDLVVATPVLPRPGETVLGEGFLAVPGGKGANQAVAAARAGADCHFLGAVGLDAFGDELKGCLAAAGVGLDGLRRVAGPSGVALIAVDAAAENLIVVAPGANAHFTGLDAGDRDLIAACDVLLCQLEIPLETVTQAALAARHGATTVVLNAAPARTLPDELLAAVDVLVVNQTEATMLAGLDGAGDAGDGLAPVNDVPLLLDALLARVPRVVLTLGAAGAAYAARDGERLEVGAPPVDAVDTTAAGDAFTGAFAVAWAQGRPVAEALRWACAAGGACASRWGASSSLPAQAEIDLLYDRTYQNDPA